MNNIILITKPEYDDATFYLSKWSEKIIDVAVKSNKTVIQLKKEKVNKTQVEKAIYSRNPYFLILNGHGDETTIYGHKDKPIVKLGENEELLKGKITYSVACNAAFKLGKSCICKNTYFVGYENKFVFSFDTNSMANPLDDSFARPFFESTNAVPISIIKGKSVKESVEKSKLLFEKWIIHYRNSSLPEAPYILFMLLWDMENLVVAQNDS